MSHRVALSFEDGVTRFITCSDGQTVADAAYRSRINIPLDCRDGACGTCKAVCESGDFDGGTYLDDALSDAEAADGYCLPCSMTPQSDLVLQIASTSAVAKTRAATYTTTVTAVDRLSPTTVRLAVAAPAGDELAFLPGQYVNISVPGPEAGSDREVGTRSYSFSCVQGSSELEFLIKLIDGGLMSSWLSRAQVGDTVSFTGPHGSFFLREAERPALLLAGGTGLAPVLAILRTLRENGSVRRVHLVYGASTDDDVVCLDVLRDLETSLPNFTWDYCVSDPASAAPHTGYVTGLIEDEHLHGGDVAVYLCGPPPMVEAVRTHFAERGVEPTGFYYEKFAPSSDAAAPPQPVSAPDVPDAPVPAVSVPDVPVPDVPGRAADAPDVPVSDDPVRRLCGQEVFASRATTSGGTSSTTVEFRDDLATARAVAGQQMLPSAGGDGVVTDDPDRDVRGDADDVAATIVGQAIRPASGDLAPLTAPRPAAPTSTAPPYEIGEEHPSVHESDAVFEARRALELGALELVVGRLSSQQIAGYRLLAEATTRYVDGDRFVDAAAYTDTNAAFHDYLFTATGNDHLLQAYTALGVKAAMAEVLRGATWCDPRCAQDHLDIVDAIEAADRERARTLIADHADRSKATMKRAMADTLAAKRPKFVSPGRFAGKVVTVTGAAQGIGEWVARRIAAEGGTLVLADRSELVDSVADELSAQGGSGGPVTAVLADLETMEGAEALASAAMDRHGRIDVAVHVVGGTIWAKPFQEYPADQIEKEIRRSLFPTLWSCRAVLPHMIAGGGGTIVNVSSVATRGIHRVPYAAAKGGVNAITSALALEAAPHGVRVVATAPGGTDAPPRRIPRGPGPADDRERQWYQDLVDQTTSSSLMGRYGTLDEQAAAICFLASDEASYITGTVLPVAGGDPG
ncbi:benzoate 1,2-dioxygenase electron transfer component BenC [Rhodococcoides corynebacterioides]|uniref:1,6-dihydroxycyclohexa-2,4-diene-1-carboxylate dehydrogenase n=1 Tax=Rhodococcoides corynebacterioides TaxID=53972 RepID=A0ABS7PAP0_9NOCA|nr:benzoate 1,2-dioxygenase electron transfer component BenC [Rhodococcus corynebacterioides]MBY6368226.1 1,6-dihydroxycyclohexa-2,4-diene-1-carboxylate dehydrogenase [Rhodococcus corynebacterioides]MBY6409841.1 1,6-dihydroxycyclohexa-2,4-diene-1-carboxylate dehydrogenase [Rhodococcus corynebacterioides]